MTNTRRYEAYQDSGEVWLGKVPEDWQIVRNKEIFEERNSRSLTGRETLLTVSHITGVTPRSEKNVNMFMAETMEGYKLCQKGDLLINTMWAWMGALGTSQYEGICSPSYHVYSPRRDVPYNARYFDYLYRIPNSVVEMTRNSTGIVSSRLRLYPKDFFQIKTILPDFKTQTSIADYLDHKTTQIDRKIELLQQKAAHYAELKQVLINETVTGKRRIIDHGPAAAKRFSVGVYEAYQDSGVEWLGEVPGHWEVKRLAGIGAFSKGGGFSKADLTEEGPAAILYGDIYTKYQLAIKKGKRKISQDASKKSVAIKRGDLLFTGSGETIEDIGKCVVYDNDEVAFAGGDIIIYRQKGNDSKFLSYFLSTDGVKAEKAKTSRGEIIVHTYASKLRQILIELPPLKEQKTIAAYLDEKTAQIEQVLETIQREIGLLQDLRKTLINDVVTGKIKVVE